MTARAIKMLPFAFVAAGFGLPALAAEPVSQETPAADACSKTVGAMGAAMSHKPDVAPDGRPIYRFLLRQNGLDYDVVCDAASGLVSDVTPRGTH
ncbi:MAG: hypothetical protein J0H65_06375 [Rhizobiales bacterium]|nr:hypothetical protein [Hyphomicrobiales bacterium]